MVEKKTNDRNLMTNSSKYAKLIQQLEFFISGECQSKEFVREIEGAFAEAGLDDDDRFQDFQETLAMFGTVEFEYDTKKLIGESRFALQLILTIKDQ
jgi:hypothetical protein